ncbi:MAG TPA: hypothetical protein DCM60_09255 [Nitrospina sp.]|nr:hypothetical protein [Nitrospina sp.]
MPFLWYFTSVVTSGKYAYDKFGEQGLAPKKYLTTVGGEGFLLGLSLRIASILIGETSQGGARA